MSAGEEGIEALDVTGYSTDFIVGAEFVYAVRRFIATQLGRWPGLLVDGVPASGRSAAHWSPEQGQGADDNPSIVGFARDPEMEQFWEDNGYALDERGEGPFSIFYRSRTGLLQGRVAELSADDPSLPAAFDGSILILTSYFTLSVVTPSDPAADHFSRSIITEFIDSFEVT